MARPEKPISPSAGPALHSLVSKLRQLREDAGLSYMQLSRRAHISTATLSRAASGDSVPSMQVVMAIARAAGLPDEEVARLSHLRAKAVIEQVNRRRTGIPREIHTSADLSQALHELYVAAGRPSVRDISEESGVSRSTVHRVITGQTAVSPAPEESGAEIVKALLPRVPPETRNELVHSSDLQALFRSFVTEYEKNQNRARVQRVLVSMEGIGEVIGDLRRRCESDAPVTDDLEQLLDKAQSYLDQARQHLPAPPKPEQDTTKMEPNWYPELNGPLESPVLDEPELPTIDLTPEPEGLDTWWVVEPSAPGHREES